MPLCYGGGVSTVEQFERIVSLGVEKVAISSAAVLNPDLITHASQRVGSQSVVVVMDVKKTKKERYQIFTHNGAKDTGVDAIEFALRSAERGAGEIVINSIDRDGMMKGYDLTLVRQVRAAVSVPLTALGGAGSLQDIAALTKEFGTIGAAAGSLFVFKGTYRAVLISYPSRAEKDTLAQTTVS